MNRQLLRCLVVGTSFCLAQNMAANRDEAIGHVIVVAGEWLDLSCGCRLDQGHIVLRRSRFVSRGTAEAFGSVKVRYWDHPEKEETFGCFHLNCREVMELDRVTEMPSGPLMMYMRAASEAVGGSLASDGLSARTLSGYARNLSRAPVANPPRDALVIATGNGAIDLTPAFAQTPEPALQLDWCEVESTGKTSSSCSAPPAPQPTYAGPNGKTIWMPREFSTGLHVIFRWEVYGNDAFRGDSAFIPVTYPTEAARQAQKDYRQFASLIAGWPESERVMVLRAYMQYLSRRLR